MLGIFDPTAMSPNEEAHGVLASLLLSPILGLPTFGVTPTWGSTCVVNYRTANQKGAPPPPPKKRKRTHVPLVPFTRATHLRGHPIFEPHLCLVDVGRGAKTDFLAVKWLDFNH